jgi:hypothetical protein
MRPYDRKAGAMRFNVTVKKLDELEAYWPGFRALWRNLKAECTTNRRTPRYVTFTDEPTTMMPDDTDCARRFAVDLVSNKILDSVHVSCGENAIANRGQEKAVRDIPAGTAVVSCTWNDYYRTFSMTVEVAPGTLKAPLAAHEERT